MLKTLIKKQFTEIFRAYFVNPKTGKVRSKGAVVGMCFLFVFIMLCLSSIFFGMSATLSGLLKIPQLSWLFFAVTGIAAILLGLFGSVFNTYSSVYLAKDNELLLSMPIPIKSLLIARLAGVVGLSFIYSGVVLIPSTVSYIIFAKRVELSALIFQIVLWIVVPFFVSALSCILGFFVALISSRLKGRSFITVIVSLLFFAVYYFFCFRMNSILASIVENGSEVGQKIRLWGNLFYQIGMASMGNVPSMLIIIGITAALCVLCFVVLDKTFLKIATLNKGEKKKVYKKTAEKQTSVDKALLNKEFKRFTSSATYMLNCGLAAIMLPLAAIVVLIKRSDILALVGRIKSADGGTIYRLIPVFLACIIYLISSMGDISAPSVSLEGKSLWIYKSLPIDTYKILRAKINLHIYVIGIPAVISALVLGYALNLEWAKTVIVAASGYAFVSFSATIGLIFGLLMPNLDWVTETTPIKQGMAVLLNILVDVAVPVIVAAVGYFTRNMLDTTNYIICVLVILCIATRYLNKWLQTKGVKLFENL